MIDTILHIKEVEKCKNGACGNFLPRSSKYALITLSLKENKTFANWCETLLHEMLHRYTSLMRSKGFRMTNKLEHDYIYACEVAITNLLLSIIRKQKLKRKKHGTNTSKRSKQRSASFYRQKYGKSYKCLGRSKSNNSTRDNS